MTTYSPDQLSSFDQHAYEAIRKRIDDFLRQAAKAQDRPGITVLDIAPQAHVGARAFFKQANVKTLDIEPTSDADYIADITLNNEVLIPTNSFEVIICTEVLEHTLNPFLAVQEILRMLRPGGILFLSAPFNFRIHGPLPDCWRFTEHGYRSLLSQFTNISINSLETPDRVLMPIHYSVTARKND